MLIRKKADKQTREYSDFRFRSFTKLEMKELKIKEMAKAKKSLRDRFLEPFLKRRSNETMFKMLKRLPY